MKVLQIIQDTPFINDFFRITCEVDKPENHDFAVYFTNSGDFNKLINLDEQVQARTRYKGANCFNEALANIREYDKVFNHNLTYEMHEFLASIPRDIKVVWFFFGSDYQHPEWKFGEMLYDEKSIKYAQQKQEKLDAINSEVTYDPYNPKFLLSHYRKKAEFWREVMRREKRKYMEVKYRMTERIDYIAGYNDLEYEFIRSNYPTRAIYLPSFYTHFTAENTLVPTEESAGRKERSILFGNCGVAGNNHEELIDVIKDKISGKSIKVKVPLSYGDPQYIPHIKKKLSAGLKSAFVPLDKYMSKPDYYSMLAQTDIALMNHKVNQAGTNIFMLLFYGKKVFTQKCNVFYRFLTRQGIKMFTMDDFRAWPIERSLEPLSKEEIEHNRKTIYSIFSKEKQQENLKRILSI